MEVSLPEPWDEFPILSTSIFAAGDDPGPVRVVYSRYGNRQSGYDVIYHDPRTEAHLLQWDWVYEMYRMVRGFAKAILIHDPRGSQS